MIMAGAMMIMACRQSSKLDYPIRPVEFSEVKIEDSFWLPRETTNREVTVAHDFEQCAVTGRLDNFAKAGGLMEGGYEGLRFNDSDVYKVIEGAAYTLAIHPDPELDAFLDDLIAKIVAAQEEDGYLFTPLIIDPENPPRMVAPERWVSERQSHELYCVGHLYEAAVAHYRATGKRSLLDVALKSADLVAFEFGPGKREVPPGHQEIELGLIKLYRLTGETEYLELAKFFLEERGDTEGRESYGEYFQDQTPALEQDEAVGHVVRVGYMYAALTDIAALTGDKRYEAAVDRVWENVVSKKIYVTGGVGGGSSEGFSAEYILPNMRAYNETCASIANALWNHRMFLLHGDGQYIDVIERTIYNAFLSGVGMSGDLFFYPNRLATVAGEERSPWFNCACCPSNVVRFIPQIAGMIYGQERDHLYVNLFISGGTTVTVGGKTVGLSQETDYPWDGKVVVRVEPESPEEFTLYIRIPGWARNQPLPGGLYRFLETSAENSILQLNGTEVPLELDRGYAVLRRRWETGDSLELALPMPVRRVLTDESVVYNRGRVALSRGPLIYCAEWPDNAEGVHHLVLPDEAELGTESRPDLLGGITVIRGRIFGTRFTDGGDAVSTDKDVAFTAIPYYAWAHRGPGQMIVWLAREPEQAWPLPADTIALQSEAEASHTGGRTTLSALNDQIVPQGSDDGEVPRFTWQPKRGTQEWVQYEFTAPARVSEVQVYWVDSEPQGVLRIPKSWRILYRRGNQWVPVANPSGYEMEIDKFNRVTFDPVRTDALRIEAQLQPDRSAGLLEWKVK
jgi:DUF1680 family protein